MANVKTIGPPIGSTIPRLPVIEPVRCGDAYIATDCGIRPATDQDGGYDGTVLEDGQPGDVVRVTFNDPQWTILNILSDTLPKHVTPATSINTGSALT